VDTEQAEHSVEQKLQLFTLKQPTRLEVSQTAIIRIAVQEAQARTAVIQAQQLQISIQKAKQLPHLSKALLKNKKLLLQICQAVMQSQIHQQAMPIRTRQKLQRVMLLIWQNLTIERKNKIWEQYLSQPKPI